MLLERRIWGTTACQPDLGVRECYGAHRLECDHVAYTRQLQDQVQSAWV